MQTQMARSSEMKIFFVHIDYLLRDKVFFENYLPVLWPPPSHTIRVTKLQWSTTIVIDFLTMIDILQTNTGWWDIFLNEAIFYRENRFV